MKRLSRVAVLLAITLAGLGPMASASAGTDPIRPLAVSSRGMAHEPPPGTLGRLTITPPVGSDYNAPTATTSDPCPSSADSAIMLLTGPVGAVDPTFPPDNPFLILTTSQVDFSTTRSFDLPFRLSLKDAAADRGKRLQAGEYQLTARCVNGLTQQAFGAFTGAMFFTSQTAWQTNDPRGPEIVTTTTLTTSPVKPGADQTVTATISPLVAAAGTVQFKDGNTNIGKPEQMPTLADNVSMMMSLPPGPHSLSAVFTPKAVNVSGSLSEAVSLVVVAAADAKSTGTTSQGTESGSPAARGPLASERDPAVNQLAASHDRAAGQGARLPVLIGVALLTLVVVTLVAVALTRLIRQHRPS